MRGVGTYSESPDTLTRNLSPRAMIALVVSGLSFTDALRTAKDRYERTEPVLSKRFPWGPNGLRSEIRPLSSYDNQPARKW